MTGIIDDDGVVLAWLCTQLAQLQSDAARDGWLPKLEAAVAALRSGTPPTTVCRRLGLTVDATQLATRVRNPTRDAGRSVINAVPAAISDLRMDPVAVRGDYVCPHGSCYRRGRSDQRGYEPVCVDGTPMLRSVE